MPGVLFLAVALPPPVTGQAAVNAAIVKTLVSRGVEIYVAEISPGSISRSIIYHLNRALKVLRGLALLVGCAGRKPSSIVFYMVVESGLGIIYNFAFVAIARTLSCHIYLHHHTSGHTLRRRLAFAVLSRLAGVNARHIVLGSAMANDLIARYAAVRNYTIANNASHIPCPKDISVSRPNGALRVGLLSNLFEEKGLDLALDIVIAARRAGANINIVLAGPVIGKDAERSLALAKRILGAEMDIRGQVAGREKDLFFRNIDVFLFPTRYRYEAQPLVIIEAMSYGLPIVTTNSGYIEELVAGFGCVFDSKSDLVTQCSRLLVDLAGDVEKRQAMGLSSLMHFRHLLDLSTRQNAALINEMVERHS